MAFLYSNNINDRLSDHLNSFDLRDELDSFNMLQENELDNFREGVEYNNPTDTIEEKSAYDALCYLINNNSNNTSSASFYANSVINGDILRFRIDSMVDYINDLYLEFQIEDELGILSIEDKLNILDSTIILEMSYQKITTLQLASLLTFQLCNGKVITKKDNTIQIPIFDFNTFKTGNYSGFPALPYQNMYVYVQTKYSLDKIKLLVTGGMQDYSIRREILYTSKEMLIFKTGSAHLYQRDMFNNTIINFCSMALIVFCMPKDPELLSLDPNITSIQLYNHHHNVRLEYNSDNILSMDILGVKIYLLPLCKQFDSWEKISNVIKYPNKFCDEPSTGFKISQRINITADDDLDNYNVFITSIGTNILSIKDGCSILKYSST